MGEHQKTKFNEEEELFIDIYLQMELSKKRKNNTKIVILVGVILLLWIGLRIVFPSFDYFLNKTDRFKISVIKYKIDQKYYITLTPLYDYPYNLLRFKLSSNQRFTENLEKAAVFKDYVSQLYPKGKLVANKDILREVLFSENHSNFANGSLVSYGEAVYFISHGKARPFLGPEIFERLGFDWDNVRPISGDQFANFEKEEKLNFTSPHPDGTILETSNGKLFIVWEEERRPVESKSMLEEVWPEYYSIKVESGSAKKIGECQRKKSFVGSVRCNVRPGKDFFSNGKTYSIEVSRNVFEKTNEAKITVSMIGNFNLTTAKESLGRVKDQLYLRYSGRVR